MSVTEQEWAALCERMVAWWPHFDWKRAAEVGSIGAWYRDVEDLDADQVATAAESLYREGHDFPRNGAQIRKRVFELSADVPTWGEVWDRLWRAAQNFGQVRQEDAFAWLEDWSPLAAQFARQLPFREFCTTTEPEVFHGQARRVWEQLVRRHERDSSLLGLPTAGLKAVEKANREPTQIGDVLRRVLPPAPAETKGAA